MDTIKTNCPRCGAPETVFDKEINGTFIIWGYNCPNCGSFYY